MHRHSLSCLVSSCAYLYRCSCVSYHIMLCCVVWLSPLLILSHAIDCKSPSLLSRHTSVCLCVCLCASLSPSLHLSGPVASAYGGRALPGVNLGLGLVKESLELGSHRTVAAREMLCASFSPTHQDRYQLPCRKLLIDSVRFKGRDSLQSESGQRSREGVSPFKGTAAVSESFASFGLFRENSCCDADAVLSQATDRMIWRRPSLLPLLFHPRFVRFQGGSNDDREQLWVLLQEHPTQRFKAMCFR
jgi:hypothetical protein